jgi:hypothetical protein
VSTNDGQSGGTNSEENDEIDRKEPGPPSTAKGSRFVDFLFSKAGPAVIGTAAVFVIKVASDNEKAKQAARREQDRRVLRFVELPWLRWDDGTDYKWDTANGDLYNSDGELLRILKCPRVQEDFDRETHVYDPQRGYVVRR